MKVELVCHKLDAAAGTCEQVERCMFERKKLPARSKASAENIGSFLVILNEIEAYNYAILCSDVDRMLSQVRLPHALPHWECNFQRCGVSARAPLVLQQGLTLLAVLLGNFVQPYLRTGAAWSLPSVQIGTSKTEEATALQLQ